MAKWIEEQKERERKMSSQLYEISSMNNSLHCLYQNQVFNCAKYGVDLISVIKYSLCSKCNLFMNCVIKKTQRMENQQQRVQSSGPSDIDFIEEFNADDFLSHLNSGANQRYA